MDRGLPGPEVEADGRGHGFAHPSMKSSSTSSSPATKSSLFSMTSETWLTKMLRNGDGVSLFTLLSAQDPSRWALRPRP